MTIKEALILKIQLEYHHYKSEFAEKSEQEKIKYFFTRLDLWKTIYYKHTIDNSLCDEFNKEFIKSIEDIKIKMLTQGLNSIVCT